MHRFPLFAAVAIVFTVLLLGMSSTAFGADDAWSVYLPFAVRGNSAATQQPTTAPTTTPTTQPSAPETFFLPFEIGGVNNTTDASLMLDTAGGTHVTYGTIPHNYAIYGYCAANCTAESKFSVVRFGGIETTESISDVTLALDPVGHPRMLWSTSAGWQYAACDANCTVAASWTATVIAPAGEATHSQRFVIDKQGRAHVIDHGDLYETRYLTCAADCADAANWSSTLISASAFAKPALAVTAAGQPRLVFQTYDFVSGEEGSHDNRLGYAACDTTCTDAANWSTSVRFEKVDQYDGSWSLALDAQGRPRLALAPWQPYGSDTAENQLYYLWCNAACGTSVGNWDKTQLTIPEESVSAVNLVLDKTEHPQMSFALSSAKDAVQRGIYHGRCVINCASNLGDWEFNLVDATAALNESDPVHDTGICSNPINPTWALGWTTALALDSAGQPQIAYDARHLWTCISSGTIRVERDINWARFAPVLK